MKDKRQTNIEHRNIQLPLIVEKDEDGFYVVECPVLEGCYTQGSSLDEALKNIREVIDLVRDEKENRDILTPQQFNDIS